MEDACKVCGGAHLTGACTEQSKGMPEDDLDDYGEFPQSEDDIRREREEEEVQKLITQGDHSQAVEKALGFDKTGGHQAMAFKHIIRDALSHKLFSVAKDTALQCYKEDEETSAEMLQEIATEQARDGLFEDASGTAESIQDDPYWKEKAYSGMSKALAEAGRFEEALSILEERIPLDSSARSNTYRSIVEQMAKADPARALDIIKNATGQVSKDHLYGAAARALNEAGMKDTASEFADHIVDKGVKRMFEE